MSGHSKWTTARYKKAAIDAEYGKLFARLIKNIGVAARTGGGDPAGDPTLFDTIQKAKKNSVPVNNITHTTKRGSGVEVGGANCETIICEGYGPSGVAFYVECLANNRSRAASDVRLVFARPGGSMADSDSIAFLSSRRGIVEVAAAGGVDENSIMETVLGAGAEEIEDLGGGFVIESDPSGVVEIRKALQVAGINYDSAKVRFVAATEVEPDLEGVVKVQHLVDALEDSDDVQNIYHNVTVSDETRTQFEEEE